ncbi:MAG: M48 family metallopeptidase [Gammaproteobacteria bacterium]|nr:M48 family metallopeptidase [Gammaproteobacteria bacterium]
MDPAQLNRNDWTIRESARAKNLRVQIFPHGAVEIVVPRRTSRRAVAAFIAEHHDWILANQAAYKARRGDEPELPETIELAAIDETFQVRYLEGQRMRVRENGDELLVFTPLQSPETVWPTLQHWLKQKARPHLSACLTRCTDETGLQPSRLQVRLQKTRWGSCSPNGTISLNAAVMLRSPEEMRYVVIHELCHLRHMNHGRRFWQLVRRFEPAYRAIDRRLAQAWDSTPLWLN